MGPLTRYQAALLARSQRWLAPLLLYAALIAIGTLGGEPLDESLGWSAAMLVPAVAWLTRAALTAQPSAARAVLAAASGPRRVHLAALLVALVGGLLFAAGGVGFDLWIGGTSGSAFGATLRSGIATSLACVLLGGAAGALCNPPLVRRTAIAVLATSLAVVGVLLVSVSPASAAISATMAGQGQHPRLPVLELFAAVGVSAVAWIVSAMVAARRTDM
jgi:hypothetical protein